MGADAAFESALRIASEGEAAAEGRALLAIVGPTASGKTELAIRLAEATGGEIVSADSVQIVRGFDVGSGKPTPEERARAPHHLVDAIDPLDPIDAARFASLARAAIDDIRARGRRPIVCGGTFLWVKALVYGLAEAPAADEAIRARHREIEATQGRPALHARLARVDPTIATRLHPNDFVRVSRALEVHELTGEPMSAWQARHGFAQPRLPTRIVAIRVDPVELTTRIASRVSRWLAAGWLDEVRALVERGFGDARAMGSVGYREVRQHLERGPGAAGAVAGREAAPALADLELAIVRATRVFARRQRTWLHHAAVEWV